MTLIDRLIFGNGYGLKTPHFDDTFFCLSGRLYHRSGWFGAQLASYEWRRPDFLEERYLLGRRFRVLHARRKWFRWEISWSMKLPDNIDQANSIIRKLEDDLRKLV